MEVVMRYRVDCRFDVMDYEIHKMGGSAYVLSIFFVLAPCKISQIIIWLNPRVGR